MRFDIDDDKRRADRLRWDDLDLARVGPMRRRLGVRDRIRPCVSQLGSMLVGERLVALHMTWGAVNEWTTLAAYMPLAQRADHPVLTELTTRIARQEGRHIDVYAAEATRRLADSPRRAARRALGPAPALAPGRIRDHPAAETDFVIGHLYGGADGLPFVAASTGASTASPGRLGWRSFRRRAGARPGCCGVGLRSCAHTSGSVLRVGC